MNKFKLLIASRKFWSAIVGLVLIIIKAWWPEFPISEDQLTTVIYLLVAYILGTGIEDGLTNKRNIK